MSCIHYKFKSSLDYRTVTFDGLHLSLCELKRMIFDRERIRASDFDLLVTNAQTNEVYDVDTAVVVRNSSVIVSRIPVEAQRKLPKIWDRGMDGVVPKQVTTETPSVANSPVNRLSAYSEAMSEEEKLKKMQEESTSDYDPSRYQRKNLIASGAPPASYICNRCGQPGHWIKMCPSLNIKRTTGIPRGELMETTADDPQAMLTSAGTYAVPFLHKQAFVMGKADKRHGDYRVGPVFPVEQKKQKLPHELLCSLCDSLLRDASLIPCCGYSYCDECIRHYLLESDDRQCPNCHENGISPTALIPNGKLREAVKAFQTSMKNVSLFPPVEDSATNTTPAITATSHSKLKVNLAQLVASRTVVITPDQQTVPSAASIDATVPSTSMSVDHRSTETKPIVSAISSSSGQQTMPPLNVPSSSVYPDVRPMLPTNPYMANFSQMVNPMQNYPPMPLSATAYPRGPYGALNMPQLVRGCMYPAGVCQVPQAYMHFHMKEAMHRSGEPTKLDEWEEFLSRQDRRRKQHRSKSPASRTSKRERSRRSFEQSPHRKHHYAGEKHSETSRPSTESPRHRRERAEPPQKSEVSPRREVCEADQLTPLKECLTRDDSGLVSLESLTGETEIEMLRESASCEYSSAAVKSQSKLPDGSSKEPIRNAGTTRPHQIVTRDRDAGRTTVDSTGVSDAREPAEGRCVEKSGDRLNKQLSDDFSSSPTPVLSEPFGDEPVEKNGGPEANVYERRDTCRRSPPLLQPAQRRHRPNFNVYRDGHASVTPQASYLESTDRSCGRAIPRHPERRKKSSAGNMVCEENSNYQSRCEMLNDKQVLESYDHTQFVTLEEESSAFEPGHLARQAMCVLEAPCPAAQPSTHQMPLVLDSTEWVVQESSNSDVYPLMPASSTGLSAAAVEMEPVVSKGVSSSNRLSSKLPKRVDKPLSSNVGIPSKSEMSSRLDKLKSKHSGERSQHRRRVDVHKQSSGKSSAASLDRQEVKETCPERKVPKSEARSNKEVKRAGKPTSETHRHGHSGHKSSHSHGHRPVGSSSSNNSRPKEAAKKTEKKATAESYSRVTGCQKLMFKSEPNK
ncbi:DWNN domain protein [Trichuris suis]|nr:DWNN domain protein [Trichuris suis]